MKLGLARRVLIGWHERETQSRPELRKARSGLSSLRRTARRSAAGSRLGLAEKAARDYAAGQDSLT